MTRAPSSRKRRFAQNAKKKVYSVVAASIVVGVALLLVAVLVEYQPSKHSLQINHLWYLFRTRFLFWNELQYAFSLNDGQYPNFARSESTLNLAMVLGLSGAIAWSSTQSRDYTHGVGRLILSCFVLCYVSPVFMRLASFPELLILLSIQMSVVTAVTTCIRFRRGDPPLRIGLRGLFGLVLLVSLLFVVPRLVDWPQYGLVFLDQAVHGGPISMFLPMIGVSSGFTTIAFHAKPKSDPLFRAIYLLVVSSLTFGYGYCLAWLFESHPFLHWGRGNLAMATFTGFRYGYAALFPLTGLVSITVCPVLLGLKNIVKAAIAKRLTCE